MTMKSAKDYLQSEVDRNLNAAKAIARDAEDDGNRSLTDDERSRVESHLATAKDLKARLAEIDANEQLQKSIDELGQVETGDVTVASSKAKTWGEAFVKSDAYQALKERGTGGRWTTGPVSLQTGAKAPGDPMLTTTGDNESLFQEQFVPGIQGPVEQRLTVADLFAQGTATASSIAILKETLTDNNAAVTAEGADKPYSELGFDKDSVAVEKIATFLPVSDEMLEDEPAMASYINARLALFVRQAEEARIVTLLLAAAASTGTAADVDGDNLFDGIAAGIAAVRIDGGLEPDGMLIHPMDQARLSVLRAVGGDGAYFSGGPYASPSQNPWGLRAVVTTAVNEGTIVVGAFATGGQVWRKGGLTVEASNSHADYFRKNLTAIRAEERVALAIYRDAAFALVTES